VAPTETAVGAAAVLVGATEPAETDLALSELHAAVDSSNVPTIPAVSSRDR
jgi:hypothetical protein